MDRSETDRQHGALYYHEWFAEWRADVSEAYDVGVVYDYVENAQTGTKDHTPVIEVQYAPGGEWSVRGEYQYQDTDRVDGIARTHLALIEYNVSSDLTLSAVGEHASEIDENFLFGQIDYHLTEEHYLSFTAGHRRGGYICVGGICRFEPEFEGVEARFITSF